MGIRNVPPFPTMLRKMWSGGEVQDWLDRNLSGLVLIDGFFIGGPSASAIVFDEADVEPTIAALCARTGDDAEDYTSTNLSDVQIEKVSDG